MIFIKYRNFRNLCRNYKKELKNGSRSTDSSGLFSIQSEIYVNSVFVEFSFVYINDNTNGCFQTKDMVMQLTSSEIQSEVKSNIEIKLDTID